MKAKYAGPLMTALVFAIVGGGIAAQKGYIDPSPFVAAIETVAAAWGQLGLGGTQTVALFIGTAFVVAGTQTLVRGLPAFPRSATVLVRNPDVDAGDVRRVSSPVELTGTAEPLESAGTTTSPYTGTECLAYVFERHEKRRTSGSGAGRSRRTWVTVEEGAEGYPFLLVDETGEVPVTAQEATVTLDFTETLSDHDSRMKEGTLEPGDEVYVYGHVRDGTTDPDAPPDASVYVGEPEGGGTFVVSDASETWTGLRFAAKAVVLTTLGGLLVGIGLLALFWTGTVQQVASALL